MVGALIDFVPACWTTTPKKQRPTIARRFRVSVLDNQNKVFPMSVVFSIPSSVFFKFLRSKREFPKILIQNSGANNVAKNAFGDFVSACWTTKHKVFPISVVFSIPSHRLFKCWTTKTKRLQFLWFSPSHQIVFLKFLRSK